jgi:hypothetical protein
MSRIRSILLTALLLSATSAAYADEFYVGRQVVTATTGACATTPLPVVQAGDTANLVYRPAIAGVQTNEGLAILNDFRALYIAPSGKASLNGTGIYKATKIGAAGVLSFYSAAYSFSIKQIGPDIVTVSGTLARAWDIEGCTITFQAVLGLKPDA